MSFRTPVWLPAGLIACLLLLWMWRRYDARQRAALAKFVSPHLRVPLTRSISAAGRRVQRGLYLAAIALLFVAIAGPLRGYRWEQISRRGNEIVFALDTSRSMLTPDVKPNRLARAKLAIDDFTNLLDGDAVGIVAFAGSAFLVCPITLDYGAFHESLNAIDTNTIPRGGTNIARAIRAAQVALRRRPGKDKILILVTDGEDLEGGALAAAAAARQDGLKIYTVGVGTSGGDLIPIPEGQGGGFVKDDAGALVKSRLDEPALKSIAATTGGIYVPLGAQGEGLEAVFLSIFGSTQKHDLAFRQQKVYIERYQWPLAASLGLLLIGLSIGTRRRRGAGRAAGAAVTVMLILLLPVMARTQERGAAAESAAAGSTVAGSTAAGSTVAGSTAAGSTETAGAQRERKEPVREFNTGTSAYRAGQFAQAAQEFQQAISLAPSSNPKRLRDQEDAYYNLGNALYRTGQKTERTSPQETLQKWTEAVKAYDTALQLRADDADSKFNRDLVERKIEALKQNQNRDPQHKSQNGGVGPQAGQPPPQPQQQQPPPSQPRQSPPPQPPPPQQSSAQPRPPQQPPGQPPPPPQPPPAKPSAQPLPAPQAEPPNGTGSRDRPPPTSAGQDAPPGGEPPRDDARDDAGLADNQHAPGQMSREEARELLDSVKGEEQRGLRAPLPVREADDPPEKPFKNW